VGHPRFGHESDLRGLGQDPVLHDRDPRPVLTIATQGSVKDLVESLNERFKTELRVEPVRDGVHLLAAAPSPVSFKLNAVDIFVCFLDGVSRDLVKGDCAARLWLANPMRFHLSKSNSLVNFSIDKLDGTLWDSFLKVDYPLSAYLRQAGFDIPMARQQLALSKTEILDLHSKLLSDIRLQPLMAKTRKVG
jgi:hypothetical protein